MALTIAAGLPDGWMQNTPSHTPTLETQRLALRPFNEDDLEALAQGIFADLEVTRYLPRRDTAPLERASRAITYFTEHWEKSGYGAWAVTGLEDGRFMGYCGLNYLTENGEVEVLYALAQPYWGRGIATKAALASTWFGFEQVGLERLIGLAMQENIASRRVLEHLGMRYEKDVHYWGLDLIYLAVSRPEFQSQGWVLQRSASGISSKTQGSSG